MSDHQGVGVMVSCWSGYDGVVDVVCSCVVLL